MLNLSKKPQIYCGSQAVLIIGLMYYRRRNYSP